MYLFIMNPYRAQLHTCTYLQILLTKKLYTNTLGLPLLLLYAIFHILYAIFHIDKTEDNLEIHFQVRLIGTGFHVTSIAYVKIYTRNGLLVYIWFLEQPMAMALLEWYVLSWDVSESLPIVFSI